MARSAPDRGRRDPLLSKISVFTPLSDDERAYLATLQEDRRDLPAQSEVLIEGQAYDRIHVLLEGWAYHFKLLPDGRRQILNFALPGDIIGFRASMFAVADNSVETLTEATVASFPAKVIVEMHERFPRLALTLNWLAAREQAMLAEQVVRIGRRSAYERLAHLFLELLQRLELVGLAHKGAFELPLTQETLADALGLSIVHVNRTLRRLRRDGLITLADRRIVITDTDRLARAAHFDDSYLPDRESGPPAEVTKPAR